MDPSATTRKCVKIHCVSLADSDLVLKIMKFVLILGSIEICSLKLKSSTLHKSSHPGKNLFFLVLFSTASLSVLVLSGAQTTNKRSLSCLILKSIHP
jgi:hypothetical protein